MQVLSRISDCTSPGQFRFAGFIALSIALHLITVIGAGPLDLSFQRPGEAPGRTELHATLVTGESASPAATPAPDTEKPPAPDAEKPEAGADAAAAPAATAEGAARAGTETAERGLALPAPDKWYTSSEVDVRAEPITEIRLRYPPDLSEPRVTGTVRVRVFIDEGGVVRKLQIAGSEPPGVFDEAAKLGWQDVRFSPARKNGVAVKSQKLIELTFTPTTI